MADKSSNHSATTPLLVLQKQQIPTTIAPWQAYLKLYIVKGTKLYAKIHNNYEKFKSGKAGVCSKYSSLFSGLDNATLSTIGPLWFYQTVITERLKSVDEDELAAVQEYIKEWHEREANIHEQPWDGLPGAENESELVKKMKYLRK